MARWFRKAVAVCRLFRLSVPEYPSMLRFHVPLIEPDVRISRIRLSDKDAFTNAHGRQPFALGRGTFGRFRTVVGL